MTKTVGLLFGLALGAPALPPYAPALQSQPLVFTHAAVIDVGAVDSRDARRLDQTVIVRGDRITAIGRTGRIRIPDGAQVIDATGQFLIPGLWDMHVHALAGNWTTASVLDLFVANGVTGVRDLGSNVDRILTLRHEITSGSRVGPRMVVSGPSVFGMRGPAGARTSISAEEARAAVRGLKQAGVDTIKLYSYLSPAAFFAAVDEAQQQGLTAVGHVPFGVRASDAAQAGLKSIEHLEGVVIETTDLEDAFREEIRHRIRDGTQGIEVPQIETDQAARYRDSYNPQRLRRLSAQFVSHRTWHCPTLISPEASAAAAEAMKNGFAAYPNLGYVSAASEALWKRALSTRFSPEQITNISVYAAYKRVLTAAMHRAGVQFLAGTDAPGPGQVPGFSLHDELGLFVRVGLSPLEALQTATINPARFMGRENDLGTVESGKLADLVLLEADPILNIENARRIGAVVVNGKYLGKHALREMLARVQGAAGRSAAAPISTQRQGRSAGVWARLEGARAWRERRQWGCPRCGVVGNTSSPDPD